MSHLNSGEAINQLLENSTPLYTFSSFVTFMREKCFFATIPETPMNAVYVGNIPCGSVIKVTSVFTFFENSVNTTVYSFLLPSKCRKRNYCITLLVPQRPVGNLSH